jgi:hypothetical protein
MDRWSEPLPRRSRRERSSAFQWRTNSRPCDKCSWRWNAEVGPAGFSPWTTLPSRYGDFWRVNTPFVRVPLLFAGSLCSFPAMCSLFSSPRGSPGKQVASRFHLDLKRPIPRIAPRLRDYHASWSKPDSRILSRKAYSRRAKTGKTGARRKFSITCKITVDELYRSDIRGTVRTCVLDVFYLPKQNPFVPLTSSRSRCRWKRLVEWDPWLMMPCHSLSFIRPQVCHLHGFAESARAYYSPSGSTWRAIAKPNSSGFTPLGWFQTSQTPPAGYSPVFGVVAATGCRSCHWRHDTAPWYAG